MKDKESQLNFCEIFLNMQVINFIIVPTTFLISLIIFSVVDFTKESILTLFIGAILIIVLHEILHAIGFIFWAGIPLKKIKFGCKLTSLVVYCHCSEPIKLRIYRRILLLPLWVTGGTTLTMVLISYMPLTILLLFIAIFLCFGDVMIFFKLRKFAPDQIVQDHLDKIGCIVHFEVPSGQPLGSDAKKNRARTIQQQYEIQNLDKYSDTHSEQSQLKRNFKTFFNLSDIKFIAGMVATVSLMYLSIWMVLYVSFHVLALNNFLSPINLSPHWKIDELYSTFSILMILGLIEPLFETVFAQMIPLLTLGIFLKHKRLKIVISASVFTALHIYAGYAGIAIGIAAGCCLAYTFLTLKKTGIVRAFIGTAIVHSIFNAISFTVLIFT